MRRIVAALVPTVVGMATSTGLTPATAEDGPELTPPAVVGPVGEPPGELPGVIEAGPMPNNGSVLVVPGITAPRSAPRARSTGPKFESASPPLVGPSEMRESTPSPLPAQMPARSTSPRSLSGRPPLTLESIPADERNRGGLTPEPVRRPVPPSPRNMSTLWRRPGGLFGRLLPPVAIDRRANGDRDALKVEPPSGPAGDAALKRRVERQIRESLGSRLRSYEVRVVGREVDVIARPARFWQKRSVKSALESLPVLGGYKARIEVID